MIHTENAWTKQKSAAILEGLLLLVVGIYLICQCIYQSTYVLPTYTFPDRPVFRVLLCAAAALTLGKIILTRQWNLRTVLLTLIAAVFFLAYRTGRELFLLMIPVLMTGIAGMDYRKVLRAYTVAIGGFLAVTILCSFTGVIDNLVFVGGGRFRSSWGIAYPTDFASLVLFFMMMFWLARKKMPESLVVLGAVLSLLVSLIICGSRTSALCGLVFLTFVLYCKVLCKTESRKGCISKLDKGIQLLMAFSFVIFAAVYFGAVLLYARGTRVGVVFDRLFSYRLYMTMRILRDHGISAFGSSYPQIGLGGTTIQAEDYYFLDSSYALLLIRYGWVLFMTTAALWTGMGIRAYRAGDRKLLCVMTLVAFHALSEHHFPDVQYNMLLVLPFAAIPRQDASITEKRSLLTRIRENGAMICCIAGLLLTAMLTAPVGLNRLRTVFDIWGTESQMGELRAVLWCALFLLASGTAAGTVCSLVSRHQKRLGPNRKLLAAIILSMMLLIGMIQTDSNVIRVADKPGHFSSEKAETLKQILDSASGKVVMNEEPELAHRHFPGISRSIWYGRDLARLKNISVVVSIREDGIVFERQGFLYTQISPEEALYSNDPSVIEALTAAGYEWTAFDAAVREVDLKAFAEFNELEVTEEKSVVLKNGQRLNHGPYLDFYGGAYRITFDLKADGIRKQNNPLCSLYVATLDGHSLVEKTVEPEDLKPDGTCSAELVFETSDIRYLQFPVFPAEGQTIEVTGIHYQRIG